ncbi:MAG TPA: CBS domain-containing protein [Gemmatimonadales bacterium]|nr:CBS domain-containing protein [Gemmatimonadales bacterium]
MKLTQLLDPDRVLLDLPGRTVREAARPLVHAVIASGRGLDPEKLEALLSEAVPGEAVTVGQQAFLLHFRTEAVSGVTAALGVTARPVHRERDESKEARIVLLLLAPPGESGAYLRALAAFARALAAGEVVALLERAGTPDEVLSAPELQGLEVPGELLVRDVLAGGVLSVGPETPLEEAARLMVEHRVAALPVVSENREVLGVVSHGEIMRHLLPQRVKKLSGEYPVPGRKSRASLPRDVLVRDVMDRSVLCLSDDQPLGDAAALMVSKRLERVPVVRDGALVGLLTREDIVRRLFGP